MVFTEEIEIAAPVEAVFGCLANKHRIERKPGALVPRLDKLTAGPVGVGTRFVEEVRMFPGVISTIRSRVTRFDSGVALEEEFEGAGLVGTMRYSFDQTGSGTRLTHVQEMRFLGLYRGFNLILPVFRIAMRRRLQAIKALLESGAAAA